MTFEEFHYFFPGYPSKQDPTEFDIHSERLTNMKVLLDMVHSWGNKSTLWKMRKEGFDLNLPV